jgi:hypothetical protein
MNNLPDKRIVLIATIFSAFLGWLTFDTYNPAGVQPSAMFCLLTVLGCISTVLAFTHKKYWDK